MKQLFGSQAWGGLSPLGRGQLRSSRGGLSPLGRGRGGSTSGSGLPPGFTLIETLCVLCIIALIAGLCLPQLKPLKIGDESTGDIGAICRVLRYARCYSISERIPAQVSFSDEQILVNAVPQKEQLSPKAQISVSNNPFWFYPTGRATPGEIVCDEQKIIVSTSGRFRIE